MSALTDRILETVVAIPVGRVMTYGDIAREAGTGARTVGRVLYRGGHDVPWWRVVTAEGRPYRGAASDARDRFIEEQTPLLSDGDDVRVDLARASWSHHVRPS